MVVRYSDASLFELVFMVSIFLLKEVKSRADVKLGEDVLGG